MIFRVLDEIVYVTADLARRPQADADIHPFDVRLPRKQQRLQLAGRFKIRLHAMLAIRHLLVQPRILE